MSRIRQFVKNHRTALLVGLVLFVVAVVLVPRETLAQAWYQIITDPVDFFIISIAWLVYGIAWLGGQLLLGLVVILVWVASYNGFISEPIVNVGWTIIRDLCNMAFIIALLYMAFNAVFGLKKGGNLLTLIINAGLINFSKAISGFVIDISQVVMLTFVHGFYKIAGGNILEGLGFTKWFTTANLSGAIDRGNTLTPAGSGAASTLTILITILIALIMIYIAVGIILTFIIVLVGRIFKLWGLLITSPVPFVKKILPGMPDVGGGGNYWGGLSKAASAGPILAFWLWLVFTSVRLYNGQFAQQIFKNAPTGPTSIAQGGTMTGQAAGFAEAGSISNILGFIIFIGMLMMALQQAQSQANAMGGWVGDAAKKVRGTAHKWTKKGLKEGARMYGEHVPASATLAMMTGPWGIGARFLQKKLRDSKLLGKYNKYLDTPNLDKMLKKGISPNARGAAKAAKHVFPILDKEKRKAKQDLRTARSTNDWFGLYADKVLKRPDLRDSFHFEYSALMSQANQAKDTMEKQGMFDDQSRTSTQFNLALSEGKMPEAVAAALKLVSEGWENPKIAIDKIVETFKPSKELEGLIGYKIERSAGEKYAPAFAKDGVTQFRRNINTNQLERANITDRLGDMADALELKTFRDVNIETSNARKFFDPTKIPDDAGEIRYMYEATMTLPRMFAARIDEFKTPVKAQAFFNAWDSKAKRDKKIKQMRQMMVLAEKQNILQPKDREIAEGFIRVMSLENAQAVFTTKVGNKNVTTQNITRAYKNEPLMISNTATGAAQGKYLYNDLTTGEFTNDTKEAYAEYQRTVLNKDASDRRNFADTPNQLDTAVSNIVSNTIAGSDAAEQDLRQDLKAIELAHSLLTNKTDNLGVLKNEVRDSAQSLRDAYERLMHLMGDDTFLDSLTDFMTPDGRQMTHREVFEASPLAKRIKAAADLAEQLSKTTKPDTLNSPLALKHRIAFDNLLASSEIGVGRLVGHTLKEKDRLRKELKAADSLFLAVRELDRATKSKTIPERVQAMLRTRELMKAAQKPLSWRFEGNETFLDEIDRLVNDLNNMDLNDSNELADDRIDGLKVQFGRIMNFYGK